MSSLSDAGANASNLIFDEVRGEFRPAADNPIAERCPNLADPRLGAEVLFASDEWFAPKERLIDPAPPIFVPGKYDDNGKWMDGWETRRKRSEGFDHCIIKLGAPGTIHGVDIDTTYFTGNYPPAASLEACVTADRPDSKTEWIEILHPVGLKGHSHHVLPIDDDRVWTHVRFNIFPDGGVARLRVYGSVHRDWKEMARGGPIDLAAIENGGWLVSCSDQHYGSPANILYPGIGANMAEGWETRRRREPGNEWAIFKLGTSGVVKRIGIDTTHFKGNFPDRCSIQAANMSTDNTHAATSNSIYWPTLLGERKLEMDRQHWFEKELNPFGPVTHVRFNVIPDGGVNRLRIFGLPA